MAQVTLVLGGARSGKSAWAERQLEHRSGRKLYIATAEALDAEMEARIAAHRARRGPQWEQCEVPLDLAQTLLAPEHQDAAILVDCLTLWLSNLLAAGRDVAQEFASLYEALEHSKAHVLLVSNEVGMGIVPEHPLARAFRDYTGQLHQDLAAGAACVVLVTAGLPLVLKGTL